MPDPLDQGVPGMPHFFQHLDTRKIVDQCAAANVNVLLVHAKDNQGNAYYNTKVAHKHSDIGARDLMAEFAQLCPAKGMKLLYYVQLSRERRSFTHPERQARDAQGRGIMKAKNDPLRASREEAPIVCMNGPHRQYIKDILAELSRNYRFDGFWLDCFGWWGKVPVCYCETCKQSYLRDTGRELPRGSLNSKEGIAYLRWRQQLNTSIMHELIDHVHSVNPALTVTHNGSATESWTDWEFCDKDDYVSHEFHFNEGQGGLSLLCRQQKALKPGVPFEIEIWRFGNRLGGAHAASRDYQVRTTPVLLAEMSAVVAHGGFPQYYDQVRPDGSLEPRSMEYLAPAFREVQSRQPWSGVGEPVPYASILWSKATGAFAPGEARRLHEDGITGVHHAFMESHLPVAVISERELEAKRWRGAKVILVDSAECLREETIAALDAFVRAGGGLVVTGRTSLRAGDGSERKDFGLADLLGVDYQGMTRYVYTFQNLDRQHAIAAGLPLHFPMSVYETLQAQVRARGGVTVLGTIVNPLLGFHMGYPPGEHTGVPCLTARQHGSGRVVYAGAALGAIYRRWNQVDTRRLILNAAVWAAGAEPPVTAEAPETVEVVAWRDEKGKRTVLHLLNRTGAGPAQGEGSLMHEVIPVHDVKIKLAQSLSGKTARVQPGNRQLATGIAGGRMTVSLPRLGLWEVIEVV